MWRMTRTEYRVSCYQSILETACMSQGGGRKLDGRETLTKLRCYSEAETLDEEDLSRRKSLERVEGSRIIQRP
jgi:hypothetical protein